MGATACTLNAPWRFVLKAVLMLMVMLATGQEVGAQATYFWRSEATSGNWQSGTGTVWWNSGANVTNLVSNPSTPVILEWGNNNILAQTNNTSGQVVHGFRLLNSSARTFSGGHIRFTNSGTSSPFILHSGTPTHTISNNIFIAGGGSGNLLRLDINNTGGLIFDGNITNNGNNINLVGSRASAGSDIRFNGVISGSGGFYINNQHHVALFGGANTMTGQLTIDAGVARLTNSGSTFGATTQNIRLANGTTLDLNNVSTTVGTVAERGTTNSGSVHLGSATLTVTGDDQTLFQGNISGTGGSLVKQGNHTLSLFGSQTYSGSTTVEAGVLATSVALATTELTITGGSFNANGADIIGDGVAVTVNGGDYNVNGSDTIGVLSGSGGTVNLSNTITLTTTVGAGSSTYGGVIAGAGSFAKAGAGELVLTGNNSYTGGTAIRAGTLVMSNNNALGTSGTVLLGATSGSDTATLRIGEDIVNSRAITVEAGGTGTRSITYAESSGTGAQLGSITLSDFAGNANSLAFNIASGGTMLFGGGVTANAGGSSTNRLAVDGGGTLIVTNDGSGISDSTRYQVRIGDGTLIIGSGTIVSRTNVAGIGHAIDLGVDLNGTIVNATSALRASNSVTISNSIYVSSTGGADRIIGASGSGASVTYSGPIGLANAALTIDSTNGQTVTVDGSITNFSGTGSLIKSGDGLAILNGANSYIGPTEINGGTLRIANSDALGTTDAGTTVASGAALEFSNGINVVGEDITLNGTGISGGGALRNVSGDNTNTGTITLASSSRINSDSGTLLLTGSIDGAAGNSLTVGGSGNTTISGATTQARALTKDGSGTLELNTVTNNYGLLTLSAGTLRHTHQLHTTGLTGSSGSTLEIVNAGVPSQFYADFDDEVYTYAGTVTGAGNFVKRGTGTQVFSGALNVDGLYIDEGVTALDGTVSGANYTALTTHVGSIIPARSMDSAELRLAGTDGGRTFSTNNSLLIAENTDSATRTLSSENTSGVNTWSGDITIDATNNGGLIITNAGGGALTLDGQISGAGGITKTGAGTLLVAGTVSNSFAGPTVVSQGSLILSNTGGAAISGSSLTINTGTVVEYAADNQLGDTTDLILAGGTLRLGNDTTGFADTLGTLTLTASSIIDLGSAPTNRFITFADSSGVTWADGAVLTILNWQGIAATPGTAAQLIFGTGGLTSTQLAQVYWESQDLQGGILIGNDGELVPVPEPRIYAAALVLLAAIGWRERRRLWALLPRFAPGTRAK